MAISHLPKLAAFAAGSPILVSGILKAHASGGANTPSTYSGAGMSAVHAGSTGLYTLNIGRGIGLYLNSVLITVGANTPSAMYGYEVIPDIDSWNGSAGTINAQIVSKTSAPTYATSTLTAVAKADFADTDYFTLVDALGNSVLFEMDTAGDGVTAGRTQCDVSGATTAADCAAIIATAINGHATLAISATDNLDGTLTLTQTIGGTDGNITATADNVANAGFSITNFSGAADAGAIAAVNLSANTYIQVIAVLSDSASDGV